MFCSHDGDLCDSINNKEAPLQISRREFNRGLLLGIPGLFCVTSLLWGNNLMTSSNNNQLAADTYNLELRKFGNLGIKLGAVSFSASMLSQTGWEPAARAIALGVNYIDTSPYYEKSEEIIGNNLGVSNRDKIFISTRWRTDGTASCDQLIDSFEKSMIRLKTDYIDFILIDDVRKSAQLTCVGSREAFSILKKRKKVGYKGIVVNYCDEEKDILKEVIRTGGFDIVVVAYNAYNYLTLRSMVESVGRRGMGVVVTSVVETTQKETSLAKRLYGRFYKTLDQASVKWALSENGIKSVLVPMQSARDVEEYVKACSEDD